MTLRERIAAVLADGDTHGTVELAPLVDGTRGGVDNTLRRMVRAGEAVKVGPGQYVAGTPVEPEPEPACVAAAELDGYGAWMADRGFSPRSRVMYGLYVRRAAVGVWDASGRELIDAELEDLEAWWSTLPASSSSRNGAKHALMNWYRFRGRRGGEPASGIDRVPAPQRLPRPVSVDELQELLGAASRLGGPHAVLGALLGYTGCRVAEATTARWHQFQLVGSEPTWCVEGKGSRRRGPKQRIVPLRETVVAELRRWRADTTSADWLFPSPRSAARHVHHSTVAKWAAEIAEEADVDATPHIWRHTVATVALDRSNNLRGVQELLGHASSATTDIYTKVLPGRLREVVNTLPDLW